MKKTRKILLYAITLILLFNAESCSSSKANQNINPIDVLNAVLTKLSINPDDAGVQYYSEGDADHVLDDILLRTIYPPSFNLEGDIVYSMDLFNKYAIVQYEKSKSVIFEMGIFRIDKQPNENENEYRNKLNKVETMCKERIVKVQNDIFAYNLEKAYIANNSKVYIYDNYVYYIIAEDYSTAYETVKSELAIK